MKTNPADKTDYVPSTNSYHGLSKREYLASIAMQGILANSTLVNSLYTGKPNLTATAAAVAAFATQCADTLITFVGD